MTQKIKVQNGGLEYSGLDPTETFKLTVVGEVDIQQQLTVSGTVWPTSLIPNAASTGMAIGLAAPNELEFYPIVLGTVASDTATAAALNAQFPAARVGQMALGPSIIYFVTGVGQWRNALGFVSNSMAIKDITADYTLVPVDCTVSTLLRVISSSPVAVSIPADTTPIPIGASVLIGKNGPGTVTVAAAPGVTVRTPAGVEILDLYGKITAIKVAANEWEIEGNLSPY